MALQTIDVGRLTKFATFHLRISDKVIDVSLLSRMRLDLLGPLHLGFLKMPWRFLVRNQLGTQATCRGYRQSI